MVKIFIMSIKPKFSELIFEGKKRFELRRSTVRVDKDDVIIVYASSPTKAIVGGLIVKGVITGSPTKLWRKHGKEFGVSRTEFRDYFDGADVGNAIEIGKTVDITPINLDTLRNLFPKFTAPQGHMRWRRGLSELVGDDVAEELVGVSGCDSNGPLFDASS